MTARRFVFAISLVVCLSSITHAQTTEDELKKRLIGKPLYLRDFWREDQLHFDGDGKLIGNSGRLSFTLAGVDVRHVHLDARQLTLEGKRVGVEFKGKAQKRVVLSIGDQPPYGEEKLSIRIDTPPDGDFKRALDGIFADGLVELAPQLPSYWQSFARTSLLASQAQPAVPVSPAVRKVGGGVKPPKLLKSLEPQFSLAAHNLHYPGKVLVNLWLDENGKPSHLSIVSAAGLGLDEQALYAVQQYSFAPATMNDKPVSVELNVEVNFQIY
jgi:TonB family protein